MASKKQGSKGDKGAKKSSTLEDKVRAKVGEEVVETLLGMDRLQLEEKLGTLAEHEAETEEFLEKNEEIERLKKELADIKGPSTDTLKGIKLQRKFIASLLSEKGR